MAWYCLQTLMGCVGAVGFAVLFNIRGHRLVWIALGSALAWAAYLVCICHEQSKFVALLCATAAAALASEVLARVLRTPVLLLLVPMLIPLIPGGDLYTMMSFLVRGETLAFGAAVQLVLAEAGAIALGIICVASAANIVAGFSGRGRRGRKEKLWNN